MSELVEIIGALIWSSDRSSKPLERGLLLAYTPAGEGDSLYRLSMSRKGDKHPSEQEIDIVMRDLKKALKAQDRLYSNMQLEPWLEKGAYRYHVIEWQEYHQAALLMIPSPSGRDDG